MEPSESVVKTLYAHSANVCAYSNPPVPACEVKLTDPAWPRVMGVVAHIRGRRAGSARYDDTMTDEERNAWDNLILLCRNCHQRVDELEPHLHSVELLHEMKERHVARYGEIEWTTESELRRVTLITLEVQYGAPLQQRGSVTVPIGTAEERDTALPITPKGGGPRVRPTGAAANRRTASWSRSTTDQLLGEDEARVHDLEGVGADASSGEADLTVNWPIVNLADADDVGEDAPVSEIRYVSDGDSASATDAERSIEQRFTEPPSSVGEG